jgi:hypothetical protein
MPASDDFLIEGSSEPARPPGTAENCQRSGLTLVPAVSRMFTRLELTAFHSRYSLSLSNSFPKSGASGNQRARPVYIRYPRGEADGQALTGSSDSVVPDRLADLRRTVLESVCSRLPHQCPKSRESSEPHRVRQQKALDRFCDGRSE